MMPGTMITTIVAITLSSAAAAQEVVERPVGPIPVADPASINLPGADAELWNQGPYNGLNGLSNGVESAIGARRTLMFDFVVPPGQIWHIDGLTWRHVWETLPPGSGTGVEVRFRTTYENRPSVPVGDWRTSTTYEEYPVFQGRDAISVAAFEPVTLIAGTHWIEAVIVGPENNFWRTADLGIGTQVWVDYADRGGFQRGDRVFGVAYDITGILTGAAESAYTLTVTGMCPGVVYFTWGGARPNRSQGLILAQRLGAYTIPTGRCAGTVLGVEGGVQLVWVFPTEVGTGKRWFIAGSHPCAWQLQLIDVQSCRLSNPAQIP
ncbi:MAG: hypothetical protein KJZ69_14855 [Phycisphaerales bacterium]|nr:hypothetical protein [Phycisphaerales bacterium]